MNSEADRGRKNIETKKILAILPNSQELQGDIYNVKVYSCDREGINWLYSGVEGNLALIVDFAVRTKYLCIFDQTNYEKVFQYELYNGFEKGFEELAPEFRSFEIDSGFIGFQFNNQDDCESFVRILTRISSMKNIFNKSKEKENDKLQNDKFKNYCKKLKEYFCEGESKYDEKYAEDGTEIFKHQNFKILNNISYDKEKKKFQFGKISEDLKQVFLSYGITIKDLENNLDFVFSLFKKVILRLGSENRLKNASLDKIEHSFLPPEQREEIRRQLEAAEAKLIEKRNPKKRKPTKTKKQLPPKKNPIKKSEENRSPTTLAIPPPPAPPALVIAPVPKIKISDNNSQRNKDRDAKPQVDVQTQIQNMVLKPIVKEDKPAENLIQKSDKNFLVNVLSTAINIRRKQLHMHDDDEDEEDDDWD